MYLKSIEVQGFKSFANKLKFEFQKGITGIVGPNGSGKSNVADAVRWVLGEQSAKQLRSGSMQDVIFAGTETRKPQSFASVAITFDNADHRLDVDYEEVTVTRRLYRSGESEYLINNAPVRLRDINEIFYDTGIGQEGYSIIGQGQIDRILSGKPEERRELFDEAAGIVKFKKRKAASLKKLEDEHQNLVRVNDILKELTDRLEPLKKQSETARIYLDQKEKLKSLDINLFLIEEERTDQQLAEISKRLDIVGDDMAETKDRFDQTKSEYERVDHELEDLDGRIASLTEKAAKNALLREQLTGQIALLREQIRTVEAQRAQNEERLNRLEEDIRSHEEEIRRRTDEMEAQKAGDGEVKAREREAVSRLEETDRAIAEITDRIEQARRNMIGMLEDRAQVKGKVQRYDTMLEQMGIRQSEIGGRLLRLKEEQQRAGEEAGRNDGEIASIRQKIEACGREENEAAGKTGELTARMTETSSRLDETQTGYHRDSSRLESLRSMAERYDGYGNGIRRIMEQKKQNPGIRGVVADLIRVPKNYETAIETALGGSIRNIVTDNEATAKHLIEYLKANKLGRATFLPLTSIRPRSLNNEEALREKGVIGVASSLVETDEEYRSLAGFLLGRIVVVDTIDNAIRIGRAYRHSLFMVTLAGESFAPGGSITGGAFKSNDNLLGRKREIAELTERTARLKKETETLRVKLDALRNERNASRDKQAAVQESRQKLLLRLNTLEMTKKQAEEQMTVSRLQSGSLEKEHAELERQIREVREKNAAIARTIADSEHEESKVNEQADELRQREDELKARRAEEAKNLESIRVEAASWAEQKAFRAETMKRLSDELGRLRNEKTSLEASFASAGEEKNGKAEQIAEVEAAIRRGEEEAAGTEEEKRKLAARRKELQDSHREFFNRRDELSDRMGRLDREHYRLTSQREKIEGGKEERASYMWEEYSLTPSEIRGIALTERSEDRAAVRKEITGIRNLIRGLGNVNVNAIDEYKELLERHTFLSSQHEDLVKSEETLKGIITELDQGMRKQFTEKFAEIRTEFDKAFQELFGGGHGTIEIDPDADILEAGISIIAHPPGKKLQNMMQLSGGEKALTAISLLFAIQNLKPSPFALLDEIEAALDDSNVERFTEYLKKLTKNTQFIVITHRRGTMVGADRLYGITMQEKGISTLVSVKLIEDSLDK